MKDARSAFGTQRLTIGLLDLPKSEDVHQRAQQHLWLDRLHQAFRRSELRRGRGRGATSEQHDGNVFEVGAHVREKARAAEIHRVEIEQDGVEGQTL